MGMMRAEQVGGAPGCFRGRQSAYRKMQKNRLNRARRRAFKQQGPYAPTDNRAFLRGWEW